MIYHMLPEWECFSAFKGGAVSKNIANMMKHDESRVVVCRRADDSWGYPEDRIIVIPSLESYSKIRGRGYFPSILTNSFLRGAFKGFISRLTHADIVWIHNQPFFGAALADEVLEHGAKLVYHVHSSTHPFRVRSLLSEFNADVMVFVSEAMRLEALRFLPHLKNTVTIHNGADELLFYPRTDPPDSSNEVPVILYVGRLHPEKGAHILLEAMKVLHRMGVPATCRFVGSSFAGGSKTTRYIKRLQKNAPPNVSFSGYRSSLDIGNEYRGADILCCPSVYQEPFGNVNIEAMACGIPVVASDVGGIAEIASGGGVVLVKPNSPFLLAAALESLLKNQQLRHRLGQEGLQSFKQRFQWSTIVRKYADVAEIASLPRETVAPTNVTVMESKR